MHNPRGSNGRGARNSNSRQRSSHEAFRLFDTQNNDAGGYSAGAAYPFACYKYRDPETGEQQRKDCNKQNVLNNDNERYEDIEMYKDKLRNLVSKDGKVTVINDEVGKTTPATYTERMKYYPGSILPIEYTAQHGAGTNTKVHSDIVIQVGCEEDNPDDISFTDDCGKPDKDIVCYPRDGTAINNIDVVNTKKIPNNPDEQQNYRYGRHESYRWYQRCSNVERNKGLWTADQKLKSDSAKATRQNPNPNENNRHGFECPEERDYYPYWGPSPWIDIAIITSNETKCNKDRLESQNIKSKEYCLCDSNDCQGDGKLPNNKEQCIAKEGQWISYAAWNQRYNDVEAPECVVGLFSRDNHLGNVEGKYAQKYNWVIPSYLKGKSTCTIRIRYNLTSSDVEDTPIVANSLLNGNELSPILDRNNNPEAVFKEIDNLCEEGYCNLGLAVNTNQYGRTFQDRSHSFKIDNKKPEECDRIINFNVRGKRGNIVQVYPSVEYDFIPNKVEMTEDDCLHVQWTGSDYNPNRQPNNAEGGPPNPNDITQAKTDRSNIVQMSFERENVPIFDATKYNMFDLDQKGYHKLAFLDQPIEDKSQCFNISYVRKINNNNNNAADRDHRNCMKLSGQDTPYFNFGLIKAKQGTHKLMSTRNNNFSNRGQKATIIVLEGSKKSTAQIVGITIGILAFVGLVSAGAVIYVPRAKRWNKKRKHALAADPESLRNNNTANGQIMINASGVPSTLNKNDSSKVNENLSPIINKTNSSAQQNLTKQTSKSEGLPPPLVVSALYNHKAEEAGELTFEKGDNIEILSKDASGWWEGRLLKNGFVGVLPSNYVSVPSSGLPDSSDDDNNKSFKTLDSI